MKKSFLPAAAVICMPAMTSIAQKVAIYENG
jgi:hypothetical protein